MKKITLLALFSVFTYALSAQNFYYKSNSSIPINVNDAVELNGKLYLVGSVDSFGVEKPYFCALNNKGLLLFDTILNSTGRFVNIHEVNKLLYISSYSNPLSGFYNFDLLEFDTNFVIQNGQFSIGGGILQKSKLINDSTILYIGYEPPPFLNSTYTGFVIKQNIISGDFTVNFPLVSVNPIMAYDIISPSAGKYHLYLNSADSANADQISVYYLNDSLQTYRTLQLNSSYTSLGADSSINGPLTAAYSSGVIHLNCIVDHPTYLNQVFSDDLTLIRYDTNYNELSVSFSGKSDTSYTTGNNSISQSSQSTFTGGTGSFEVIVNHYDSIGNSLQSSFYSNGSLLEFKKIVTFKDSLFIIGITNDQFFAIKLDSLPNQIFTSLNNNAVKNSKIKIYPNPVSTYLNISLENEKLKQLEVFNQSGTLIKVINSLQSMKLNTEDLKPGIYFIRLTTVQQKVHSITFIKP